MCILEHRQIKMHIIYLDLAVTWVFFRLLLTAYNLIMFDYIKKYHIQIIHEGTRSGWPCAKLPSIYWFQTDLDEATINLMA